MSAWKSLLDKIGVVGSFLAAACCLGLLFAAIGLGFLIKDAILRAELKDLRKA